MTADELALKVAQHFIVAEGTGPAFGIDIIEVREAYARIGMTIRPDMLNGHQTTHGGMIFTLADTAFAYACNSRNVATVAQHASISFLAPGRLGDRLIAEARELSTSGRSGVYSVNIRKDTGEIVAEFHGLARAVGGPVITISEDSIHA